MTTAELLGDLLRRDVLLIAAGHDVEVDAPKGAVTEDDRIAIRQHKPALIELLSGAGDDNDRPQRWPIDLREELRLEAAVIRQRTRRATNARLRMRFANLLAEMPGGTDLDLAMQWRDRLIDLEISAKAQNVNVPMANK